jgi:hypothetical protein
MTAMDRVELTRSASAGSDAVKAGRTKFLPGFIPEDEDRYSQYLKRAYYTNFTGRTAAAMNGAVFRKPFKKRELPTQIEYLFENADGEGMSLEQLAKRSVDELLKAGNYGFLAEYPEGPENPSLEQIQQMGLRANIKTYNVENIINFDTDTIGGETVLTLVVLHEAEKVYADPYDWTYESHYRVLRLAQESDGSPYVYTQAVYKEGGEVVREPFTPRQNGKVMQRIPFYFCGTVDNKAGYDKPALYDIAEVNLAHYRNTADREEMLYMTGQKMIHIDIGDTAPSDWEKHNPNGVTLGSRRAIITKNGDAKILESSPDSEIGNAIKEKEDQIVAIGAKLITGNSANETAETARINASSETSVLNNIVGNVSEALEGACEDCARFMGIDGEGVEIELNDSFYDETLTFQDIQAMILLKDSGLYTEEMALDKMRATGWIDSDLSNQDIINEADNAPAGMMDVD